MLWTASSTKNRHTKIDKEEEKKVHFTQIIPDVKAKSIPVFWCKTDSLSHGFHQLRDSGSISELCELPNK